MPKFDKPDSPNIIWGVNALDADLTRPDDSYIQTGWTQVKPPYEYENYSMNKLYQGFAYYNQLGFPEWDSVTEYQAGKSYVQGSNNRVYKCIQTHINRNPATSGNEDWWEIFEGNRQATTEQRGTVEFATDSETTNFTDSTVAINPLNLFATLPLANLDANGSTEFFVNDGGVARKLKIQWRLDYSMSSSPENIPFPEAFQNACLVVIPVDFGSGGPYTFRINSVAKSSFSASSYLSDGVEQRALSMSFLAIGY